ncbi:MAG: hypothetical protein WD872_20410 [Pirellulaceae bacterium]
MNRALFVLAAALFAGCQNGGWNNPYAAIGPATIPPPGMPAATAGGYYQPPPVTGIAPAASPAATSNSNASGEGPIRIVEAGPAARSISRSSPATIAATPASRSTSQAVGATPAVRFNPASAPREMSQLPRVSPAIPATPSPALQRTRGFGEGAPPNLAPPAAIPKNRFSAAPPSIRRDTAVVPAGYTQATATFVETTTAATGTWKSR